MNIEVAREDIEVSLNNSIDNVNYTKYKFYKIDKERFANYPTSIKRNKIRIKECISWENESYISKLLCR